MSQGLPFKTPRVCADYASHVMSVPMDARYTSVPLKASRPNLEYCNVTIESHVARYWRGCGLIRPHFAQRLAK
jgi:hypothetical protein